MSFIDSIRRRFAVTGSNPAYKEDDPRSYGAGVIQRLKINRGFGGQDKDYEPHIGKNRTYMNIYLSDPIVRTLIDLPCLYAVKDNFDIVTANNDVREEVEEMFRDINIEHILYGWVRNARIFGTGYLEWTGDNLVLRSSQNMYVKRNEHGQIMYYYQKVGDDEESVRFEEDEIIELKNNQFDEIVEAFNTLAPGEDIIHGNDIVIKELQGSQRAFEYGKYTDDILDKIHVALKTPRTMWTDPEKARPIFEPYVRYLQTMIEGALNSQLMPQLEKGEAKFKFRQINVDDAFTKAKTDMIYLSEGVLSPGEVREERGLNAEGVATLDMETSEDIKASPISQEQTDRNVNITGGKDTDKREESARAQNRGNQPSANATGDRA